MAFVHKVPTVGVLVLACLLATSLCYADRERLPDADASASADANATDKRQHVVAYTPTDETIGFEHSLGVATYLGTGEHLVAGYGLTLATTSEWKKWLVSPSARWNIINIAMDDETDGSLVRQSAVFQLALGRRFSFGKSTADFLLAPVIRVEDRRVSESPPAHGAAVDFGFVVRERFHDKDWFKCEDPLAWFSEFAWEVYPGVMGRYDPSDSRPTRAMMSTTISVGFVWR